MKNIKKTIFDKTFFEKVTSVNLENMTSVNLGKTFEYLKIQEGIRSENLTEYYLCKGIFLYVFLYPEMMQGQSKTNHWNSQNIMIICLKGISEGCFSFSIIINGSLKFLWALGGFWEGTQALRGHSKGTLALKTHRHLGQSRHSKYFI